MASCVVGAKPLPKPMVTFDIPRGTDFNLKKLYKKQLTFIDEIALENIAYNLPAMLCRGKTNEYQKW